MENVEEEEERKKKRKRDIERMSDHETDHNDTSSDSDFFKSSFKFEDVSDCSDVTYLAREMRIKERLPNKDAVKLFNLHVKLEHIVPPQHKIETRAGSHVPSKEITEQFERIVPLKKGVYSPEEDEIIVHNWKRFCMLHDWNEADRRPFLEMRIGTETHMRNLSQRRKFVQFLANGLPNRTLYSVYHRFKNLYINNKRTRYEYEEDEIIINHLENNPTLDEKRKYADLAKVLQRTRHSVWRRYRILRKRKKESEEF